MSLSLVGGEYNERISMRIRKEVSEYSMTQPAKKNFFSLSAEFFFNNNVEIVPMGVPYMAEKQNNEKKKKQRSIVYIYAFIRKE